MKFIQLSDIHITKNNKLFETISPEENLKKALKHILENHSNIEFITFSGDLTQDGLLEEYKILYEIVKDFPIPIFPIIGNHDIRKNFWRYFPEYSNGEYVQYIKEIDNNIFIFLDSVIEKKHSGYMDEKRLSWLINNLNKYKTNNIFLFMHHHPVYIDMPPMDNFFNFQNSKELWDIILKYKNIKHIFFGHTHRNCYGNYKGVGISCATSSLYQFAYTPKSNKEYISLDESPTYAVVTIEKDNLLIHNTTFLSTNKKLL